MNLNDRQNTLNGLKQFEKEWMQIERKAKLKLENVRDIIASIESPLSSKLNSLIDPITVDKKEKDLLRKLEKASLSNKFLLTLELHQKFMRTKEISQYLKLKLGNDTKYSTEKLSQKTAGLKKLDKITKIQVGTAKFNSYWGFSSWLDKNGEIIEEYKYEQ